MSILYLFPRKIHLLPHENTQKKLAVLLWDIIATIWFNIEKTSLYKIIYLCFYQKLLRINRPEKMNYYTYYLLKKHTIMKKLIHTLALQSIKVKLLGLLLFLAGKLTGMFR